MLTRLIASLLIRNERLVKGRSFKDFQDAGRPDTTARSLDAQKIDELLAIDIEASRQGTVPEYKSFSKIAETTSTPLTVGGGISSIDIARACFDAGADKLALNTTALDNPDLIDGLANRFGAQAVVLNIDLVADGDTGDYLLYDHRTRAAATNIDWRAWLRDAVSRGVGEVRLMRVEHEGCKSGLDVAMIRAARETVEVPLILEGGARSLDDISAAVSAGAMNIGLGAMLVFADNNIHKIKAHLKNAGHAVRI